MLAAVAGAAAAVQQPAPSPERERGQLELPAPPPKPKPEPQPQVKAPELVAPSGFWTVPAANRVEEVFARFEREPAIQEPTLRTYLDELRSMGLGTRETALKALGSPHAPSLVLASRLLVSVGKREDAEALAAAASVAGTLDSASACLEAATRLNGGWLPETAARLLDHPQRTVRSAVEGRLAKLPHDSHVPALLDYLRNGRDSDVRLRAARLLRSFTGNEDVRAALTAALADASVPVCFEAAEALAGSGRPEEVAWIRERILAAELGPELGYVVHGLLRQQQAVSVLLVDEAMLARLRLALGTGDLFVSGAAAAALAEYHFRSESEDGIGRLEGEVLHALVRAVGGKAFYAQYARFSPLAEESLKRITGEDFRGQDRSAWLAWHAANYEGFRSVRGVLPLLPADYARLEVSWQRGDGAARVLAGSGAAAAGPGTRLLGDGGLEAMVAALDEAQLLEVAVLPGTYGPPEEPVGLRLEIHAGTRRKRLTFRGQSGASWLPAVLERLERLHQESAWQSLGAPGEERAFVLERLERWDRADALERRRCLVEWSLGCAPRLADATLAAWCEKLVAEPELEGVWDARLGRELLAEIPARAGDTALASLLLGAGLRVPAPDVLGPFLDALAGLEEPLRSDLLLQGLIRFGPVAAAEVLRRDERLPVRVAAARALGRAGGAGRDALLAAVEDPNPLVVRMALRSLGELGDRSVLPQVLARSEPGQPKEVRKEALWALGQLRAVEGVPALALAARDEDNGIRLAAVDALGHVPGKAVEEAFVALFPEYAATPLEVPFLRALEQRGAAAARAVLERHLETLQPMAARRAAIHAGRLGDPVAAPFLVGLLAETPNDPELLDALAFSLCVDFRNTPDPAGVYTAWWRDNSRRSPSIWLAKAAADCGLPLPDEFTQPDAKHPTECAQALLRLLESGPGDLRPAATYYLYQLTGVDAPALTGHTPKPVVQQTAQGWHAWLQARASG
ncbi:MAG: HEAT repeat domain-containing protein [Planctomycetota bacterium]|nr:MAG: HEAT repeat domain-containing protein [Planctomycetota bacterium]